MCTYVCRADGTSVSLRWTPIGGKGDTLYYFGSGDTRPRILLVYLIFGFAGPMLEDLTPMSSFYFEEAEAWSQEAAVLGAVSHA